MAAYMQVGRFGDWFDDSSADVGTDAGGTDYPAEYPASPGVTTGSEGSGPSVDWTSVIATGINVAGQIIRPGAVATPVGATPTGVVARPGQTVGGISGGVSSNMLVLGGLGIAALLFLKK
jgi:hypothetical protein